jgi:hypothetical protein
MTSDEIVSKFGLPDRTRVETFGTRTASPWQCLIWEYDMGPHPRGRYQGINNTNRFHFEAKYSPPRLNSWDIELTYDISQR